MNVFVIDTDRRTSLKIETSQTLVANFCLLLNRRIQFVMILRLTRTATDSSQEPVHNRLWKKKTWMLFRKRVQTLGLVDPQIIVMTRGWLIGNSLPCVFYSLQLFSCMKVSCFSFSFIFLFRCCIWNGSASPLHRSTRLDDDDLALITPDDSRMMIDDSWHQSWIVS